MREFVYILLLGCAFFLHGCDATLQEYDIPAQNYAKAGEQGDASTGTLLGRVIFPSEYAQLSARVTIAGRTFTSHPDGRFRIEEIPAGSHQMVVSAKGYESLTRNIIITPGQAAKQEDLLLHTARALVFGRLVNEKGASAADITLQLQPAGGTAVTDNDGIFQFIGVRSGSHMLRISDSKFFTYDREIKVDPDQRQNLGNIAVFRRTDSPIKRTARLNEK